VHWTSTLVELPQKMCKNSRRAKPREDGDIPITPAVSLMMLCKIVKVEVYVREVR